MTVIDRTRARREQTPMVTFVEVVEMEDDR
jgi:hypothetical protein